MINSLGPDQIQEIKTIFSSYTETVEEKKQLASEESALKEKLAGVIEGSKRQAGKLLKMMLKRSEGDSSDDEVSAVYDVVIGQTNG